jgi:hypothetical protein
MEFCQVKPRGHAHSMTIYISGFLADLAATRTEVGRRVVRGNAGRARRPSRRRDIDPTSFVRVARSLSRWRDEKRGRVVIQFPERSTRESRPGFSLPVRTSFSLHSSSHLGIFDTVPERVALRR